jgi:predicted Zn-dependent protease
MTQKAESLFQEAIERYQAGETAKTLIPVFQDICDKSGKNSPAWTCLSWLYLLEDRPTSAYKAAQKAVKFNPDDPQARINLAIAMLECQQKGVREHIDRALQLIMISSELKEEVQRNFEEGLSRRPDWKSLERVRRWLFEAED